MARHRLRCTGGKRSQEKTYASLDITNKSSSRINKKQVGRIKEYNQGLEGDTEKCTPSTKNLNLLQRKVETLGIK